MECSSNLTGGAMPEFTTSSFGKLTRHEHKLKSVCISFLTFVFDFVSLLLYAVCSFVVRYRSVILAVPFSHDRLVIGGRFTQRSPVVAEFHIVFRVPMRSE